MLHTVQTALNPTLKTKSVSKPVARSARLGLRSNPAQVSILKRAADASHNSLTDFILDSACLAAEHALLEQRLFMVDGQTYENILTLLDRPAKDSAGLSGLFARPAPWDTGTPVKL